MPPAPWFVLEADGEIPLPDFLGVAGQKDETWWLGLLTSIHNSGLFGCLDNMPAHNMLTAFRTGQGIEAHPYFPFGLHTKCLTLTYYKRWMKGQGHTMFKFMPSGSMSHSGRSKARGYLKVLAKELIPGSSEFYLHDLLCYMYRGPAPVDGSTYHAIHLCECKACLCAWHLDWRLPSENMQRHVEKKKDSKKRGRPP